MRTKILDAAISLLFSGGYCAATTTRVAKKAAVSRGAMTYHFRTRVDLMLAVAERVIADRTAYRMTHIVHAHAPGLERYYATADVNWDIEQQPGSVALVEIMMAGRHQRALQQRVTVYLEGVRRRAALAVANDLGVDDIAAIEDMLMVHLATLQGLTIKLMLARRPDAIGRARSLCKQYESAFVADLMARNKVARR